MRWRIVLTAVLGLSALTAPSAVADPVRIQSGFVTLNEDPTRSFGLDFGLTGEGFSVVGEDTTVFDYLAGFSPSESPFQLRFTGVPDPSSNSSCPGCTYSGEFLFHFRPLSASGLWSFTMSAVLMGTMPGAQTATLMAELVGGGKMHYGGSSLAFVFNPDPAPVPEPATLLLAATGAAILRRRWRSGLKARQSAAAV